MWCVVTMCVCMLAGDDNDGGDRIQLQLILGVPTMTLNALLNRWMASVNVERYFLQSPACASEAWLNVDNMVAAYSSGRKDLNQSQRGSLIMGPPKRNERMTSASRTND